MEAAIYARVSTERQDLQQTIESQIAILTAWIRQQGDHLADEHHYCDRGYSGARLDRPALDRLRDDAQAGPSASSPSSPPTGWPASMPTRRSSSTSCGGGAARSS